MNLRPFVALFKLAVVVLLLAGLAGYVAAATAQTPSTCIPFTVSHKRIIVPVMVNGAGPYPFLLDSGSTGTIIDKSIAKDLPNTGYVTVSGIGAKKWVFASSLDAISVGGYVDHKLPVMVYDLLGAEAMDSIKALGILGNDVLMDAGGFTVNYSTMCVEVR